MGKVLGIVVKVNHPEFPKEFDDKAKKYMEAVAIVFRASVFRYLGLLMKYSRVDTGRMKSAWTPIMEAYQFDYTPFLVGGKNLDPGAIAEGKKQGSYRYNPNSDPFLLTVVNSVKYASIVEEKYGMTHIGPLTALIPRFEAYFQEGYGYLNSKLKEGFDTGKFPNQNDLPRGIY